MDPSEVLVSPKTPWELKFLTEELGRKWLHSASVRASFSTGRCAGSRKDPNLERVIKFVVIVNIEFGIPAFRVHGLCWDFMSHGHDYDAGISLSWILCWPSFLRILTMSSKEHDMRGKSMTRQRNKPCREEMTSEEWRNLVNCLAETSGPDPVWDRHESLSSFGKLEHAVQQCIKTGEHRETDIAGWRGATTLIILVPVDIFWVS